jgi:hypothetical protein
MVFDRARFDTLRDNTSKARAVSASNLFQTPEAIADKMAGLLTLSADSVVLEPSAGLGRIYKALRRVHGGPVVLAEQSADCCRELYAITEQDRAATIRQGDFLEMDIKADAVIMNPPFKMGRDIKHILHAFECLAPGGLLVSLCYNGVKQNKQLKPIADTWEVLPAGSFKAEGTRAEIVLLTMKKIN